MATQKQQGNVVLIIIGLIVVFLIGAVGAYVFIVRNQKSDTAATATEQTASSSSQSSSANNSDSGAVARRNTKRANDADRALANVETYIADNNGQLPTAVFSGLTDGMEQYKTVTILRGDQAAVTKDQLVIVTGATCSDGGGSVAASTRAVAALYGYEQPDGTFKGKCNEG